LAACTPAPAAPAQGPTQAAQPAAQTSAPAATSAPAQAAPTAAAPAEGKPVIFVEGTDVTVFDPTIVTDTPTTSVLTMLYDGLVTWDKDLKILPALATKWTTSDDKRTWTFELRDDVKFHDGSPFNAEAAKYSIERVLDPATGSAVRAIWSNLLDKVDAPDAKTLKITTKEPYADLLINLAPSTAGIVAPAAAQKLGKDFARNPVGTGPFVIKDWVANDRLVLAPNPNYWGPKPKVSQFTYRPIPDASSRAAVLRTGEADIVVKLPPEELKNLEGDANVNVLRLDSMYQVSWEMNVEKTSPPLNDKRFRQALNYAVDKAAICKKIMQDLAVPIVSPFTPKVDFRVELQPYAYDPDKAKQLIGEAGAAGAKVAVWSPQGRYLKDKEASEAMVNFLRDVGLDATLQIWEWAPYQAAVRDNPERQAFMLGRATPGADYFTTRLFTKAAIGQYNVTGFNTPRVEELAALGRSTFDEQQRAAAYREIQEIVWDEAPWLFGYNQKSLVGTRKNITGLEMLPQESFLLNQVAKA
jgi:ABC-type transport system substrate-binding protein